jgi:SAM-dependent methyltransferase/mannose-6-phosphate isomerase-like protein (cupin superfamily)
LTAAPRPRRLAGTTSEQHPVGRKDDDDRNGTYLSKRRTLLTGALAADLLLDSDASDGRCSLVEQVLAPRALGAPVHTHRNEDEYSLVLEGTLGVEIGGATFTATTGSVIAKPRRIPHAFWNATDAPVRVLELIVPGGFETYFSELGAILSQPGPPDIPALIELARHYDLELDPASIPRLASEHALDLGAGHPKAPGDWNWDELHSGTPPWETGAAQPALVRLAEAGLLRGRLLDVGCGSGDNTILAATHGATALGVDISARAIEKARAKAAQQHARVRFEVADALALNGLDERFDTIVDSGMFHVLEPRDRPRYTAQLRAVLADGGICYLLCFADTTPGTWGPRRITQDELRDTFRDGWTIDWIQPEPFALPQGNPVSEAHAWLAALRPS